MIVRRCVGRTARGRVLLVTAWLLASQPGCSGRSKLLGQSADLSELASICPGERGRSLVLGAHGAYNELFGLRARIVRLDRGATRGVLVHDGEGSVIDASCPGRGTIWALVRRVRPGTPDVVRDFWLLASSNGGDTWRHVGLPPQDSVSYVELIDERRGWVLGYRGAFVTTDGGSSWSVVKDPPQPELVKNLLGWAKGAGAITFQDGRLEIRDWQLRLVRSRSLGPHTKVQCLAWSGRDRLLVVTKTEESGRRRAGALEVRLPDLETAAEVSGLPEDFVCGSAAGGPPGAAVAGANVDSAGFFGISHAAFVLDAGASELDPIRIRQSREAVLAFDGRGPIVGQVDRSGSGTRVEVRRGR